MVKPNIKLPLIPFLNLIQYNLLTFIGIKTQKEQKLPTSALSLVKTKLVEVIALLCYTLRRNAYVSR